MKKFLHYGSVLSLFVICISIGIHRRNQPKKDEVLNKTQQCQWLEIIQGCPSNLSTSTSLRTWPTLTTMPKLAKAKSKSNENLLKGMPRQNCGIVLALAMCAKLDTQTNQDFGLPDSEDVLKVKYGFERQVNQTLILIKSVLLARQYESNASSSKHLPRGGAHCLEIILFTNKKSAFGEIEKQVSSWNVNFTKSFRLTYRRAEFPAEYKFMETNYAPCASLRLFIPQLLPDYDSVIYTDTDILFFQSTRELWNQFSLFSNETIVAMAPDQYGYTLDAHIDTIKYPGKSGVNSGLILMNLTRIRAMDHIWIPSPETLKKSDQRTFDQDLLNTYFHVHIEKLHILPCYWNFQDIFCQKTLLCKTGEAGIRLLQGSGHRFTSSGSEPRFYEIFKEFQSINMSLPPWNFSSTELLKNVRSKLDNVNSDDSLCDKRSDFNNIALQGLNNMFRMK